MYVRIDKVAPYTGAWIETDVKLLRVPVEDVAPYTGAWIETHTGAVYQMI